MSVKIICDGCRLVEPARYFITESGCKTQNILLPIGWCGVLYTDQDGADHYYNFCSGNGCYGRWLESYPDFIASYFETNNSNAQS
jgi:hypothetical protein